MANKVLLMILDGWGKGDHGHDIRLRGDSGELWHRHKCVIWLQG